MLYELIPRAPPDQRRCGGAGMLYGRTDTSAVSVSRTAAPCVRQGRRTPGTQDNGWRSPLTMLYVHLSRSHPIYGDCSRLDTRLFWKVRDVTGPCDPLPMLASKGANCERSREGSELGHYFYIFFGRGWGDRVQLKRVNVLFLLMCLCLDQRLSLRLLVYFYVSHLFSLSINQIELIIDPHFFQGVKIK